MQFRKRIFSLLLVVSLPFSSLYGLQPERRIFALLTIKDYRQACLEAEQLVGSYPDSKIAWQAYIKSLAKVGDEKKLLAVWGDYLSRFPEDSNNRELLESIAWGVIEKGVNSPSPLVRIYSSLGAFIGQDAKSVVVLRNALQDSNPQIRAVTVKLASNFRDSSLQEEVFRLLSSERNSLVRVEIIKALGKMKIKEAEKKLVAILSSSSSLAEEKASAIEALVTLIESANRSEIKKLSLSKRAGLRELACQVISHTFDCDNSDLLIPLLHDHSSDVRCSAVQTLGLLRLNECNGTEISTYLAPLLQDPDPYVAISAAWAMTLYEPRQGLAAFNRWLTHPNKEWRHFASGALAATGKYGTPLMQNMLVEINDPFVQVNLALGLIAQRQETARASKVLSRFLDTVNDRIMWRKKGHIRYIATTHVKFHPLIPNLPESTNQLTRLELLNVLAIMDDPQAPVVARNFLKKRAWGVSGLAAALLLTEGDDQSIEIVEELLTDSDRKIRVQAALILALWGRGENAINVLQDAYRDADREVKERIIEGIGQIGSENSIPFLVGALGEPSQTLRIIASASLLKCLYH